MGWLLYIKSHSRIMVFKKQQFPKPCYCKSRRSIRDVFSPIMETLCNSCLCFILLCCRCKPKWKSTETVLRRTNTLFVRKSICWEPAVATYSHMIWRSTTKTCSVSGRKRPRRWAKFVSSSKVISTTSGPCWRSRALIISRLRAFFKWLFSG